jgi:hypothetical protein
MWTIIAFISFVVVVAVVARLSRRNSENDLNTLKRQASCDHPYTYRMSGKKLCAACGKEIPREAPQEGAGW